MTVQKIKPKDALETDAIFIDTRTPKEFDLDSIPGAKNFYILDNEQRHEVGILYKVNNEEGINLGYKYYHENLPELTKNITSLPKDKKLIFFCWRGGMRSAKMTELAIKLGYEAIQMEGGYKEYRSYLREYFANYQGPTFIVLYGLAGSGKTDLIKLLPNSIDLEGYAKHRSSVFGAIGLRPNCQKKFESLLFQKLEQLKNEKFIFVEGESRKVGDLFIPESIYKAMNKGIGVRITCSIDKRTERITKDYFTHGEDEKIKKIIMSLKEALTKKVAIHLTELFDKKEYDEVARVLLEDYYDSKYEHQMSDKDITHEINNDDPEKAAKELLKIFH